jgi:hypothetical protein
LLGACSSASSDAEQNDGTAQWCLWKSNGAPDAMAAIRSFLGAAKQQDIQSLGIFWGDAQGPARDRMERTEGRESES